MNDNVQVSLRLTRHQAEELNTLLSVVLNAPDFGTPAERIAWAQIVRRLRATRGRAGMVDHG